MGKFIVLGGALTGAFLLAPKEAQAAPTAIASIITTSVCAGPTLIPQLAHRNFWDNGGGIQQLHPCAATITDSGGGMTTFHWARLSVPVSRRVTSTTAYIRLNVHANQDWKMCSTAYIVDNNGDLTSSVGLMNSINGQYCSAGVQFPNCTPSTCYIAQQLRGTATLPAGGAIGIDVAGVHGTWAESAFVTYEMNGTSYI